MKAMNGMSDEVRTAGPVLRSSEMAQMIVDALREDNPGTELIVADHSGYIRVEGAGGLVLRRATVEQVLGRPFRMQELELIMTGFSGKIETTTEEVRWYFRSAS